LLGHDRALTLLDPSTVAFNNRATFHLLIHAVRTIPIRLLATAPRHRSSLASQPFASSAVLGWWPISGSCAAAQLTAGSRARIGVRSLGHFQFFSCSRRLPLTYRFRCSFCFGQEPCRLGADVTAPRQSTLASPGARGQLGLGSLRLDLRCCRNRCKLVTLDHRFVRLVVALTRRSRGAALAEDRPAWAGF
jgi:hypothetical protein